MNLKTYLFTLLGIIFWSITAHTARPISVIELDQGACWLKNYDDGSWKISSFNDQKTAILHQNYTLDLSFHPQLTKHLKNLNFNAFPKSKYDVFIHCSTGGSTIILDFYEDDAPLCIWAKLDASHLQINKVYANHNRIKDVPCYGQAPRELYLQLKHSSNPGEVIDYILSQPHLKKMISKINFSVELGVKYLWLTLKQTYAFKENEVKKVLASDAALMKMTQSLDYNSIFTFVGESHKLFEHEYPGF